MTFGRRCTEIAIKRHISALDDVATVHQLTQSTQFLCSIDTMILSLLTLASLTSAAWIVPGARWKDTDGNLFNAHAGGLCVDRDSGKFFWFGEYKTEEQEEGGGISVYSSSDLATWESHGLALTPEEGHEHISPESIIQRPKVLYSEDTGKYHVSTNELLRCGEMLIE